MLNYQAWLEKSGVARILLVQIERNLNTVTEYLSTHHVVVSGQVYQGIVKSSFNINESISTEYSASISYGAIELVNGNGELDSWLNSPYIWANKAIRIYVGELPQAGTTANLQDNFELIFDGIIDDVDAKDRSTLALKLRDKLEKLNTALTEELLGNYYNKQENVPISTYKNQNSTKLKPLCFGEVFNITPLLADPVNLEYMVHSAAVEQIIEVRDNGVPVLFTTDTIKPGSFRLIRNPAGTITCSVQGSLLNVNTSTGAVTNQYSATAKNVILSILRNFGKTLTAQEIELTSFAGSFANELVGVYYPERANVLQVCQDLAKSCGCVLSVTRLGKVKIVDIAIPTSATVNILDSDIFLNTLTISKRIDVLAGIKLGYAKNYTIQNNLVTFIPQEHKDLFAQEYKEAQAIDAVVKQNYSVTTEPTLVPTNLINETDANALATKRLNLFKAQRTVYKMKCTAKHLSLELGSAVRITSSRFGLSNSLGLVISCKPDWMLGNIELEVLI